MYKHLETPHLQSRSSIADNITTFTAAVTRHELINSGTNRKIRWILKMKPNLFQSHCADNLSVEFSKQGMALNIRIGFTRYVQRLFYLKFFYKPLHISRYHFPHNVLKPVSARSPCTHYTETMLRSFLTERKFGSSFSRRVFSSALLRVCLLPSVFAYLSKTAMVIPIAVSSWDMLLLESGFLLNRNSLRALSEDGDWS